jgi:hypothetical protein
VHWFTSRLLLEGIQCANNDAVQVLAVEHHVELCCAALALCPHPVAGLERGADAR